MQLSLSKLDAFFLGVTTALVVVISLLDMPGSIRHDGGRSGLVEFVRMLTSVTAIVMELWKVTGKFGRVSRQPTDVDG
jgi:hypothetical protein